MVLLDTLIMIYIIMIDIIEKLIFEIIFYEISYPLIRKQLLYINQN